MSNIRPVTMVSGCFDGLHAGHLWFLEYVLRTYQLPIVVALGRDDNLRTLKGPDRPRFPYAERAYCLSRIKGVDRVIPASGHGIIDFLAELRTIGPRYFVVGEDGHSSAKQSAVWDACQAEYVVVPNREMTPYPHRSSTALFTSK